MRRRPDNPDRCPARFTRIELLVVIASKRIGPK
jgi:hypothetical protein